MQSRISLLLLATLTPLFFGACGDASEHSRQSSLSGQASQVQVPSGSISHHAAARFLDQSSMGPTPSAIARLQSLGFNAWIDEQLKKPPSLISTPPELVNYDPVANPANDDRAWANHTNALFDLAVGADDQLRYRVTWVLSNFLVTSTQTIQPYGGSEYWNTLTRHAFASYGDMLKAITLSPAMGHYLDNASNTVGQLNENYGRELMQLFSVGMILLNADGTVKRDSTGKIVETYNQKDVIEITRALTGWQFAPLPESLAKIPNNTNGRNYGTQMISKPFAAHDTGKKVLLGKTIASGGDAMTDLNSVIQILMDHPNTAPFVSLRLIQGLTTSAPSPAYIQRISAEFQRTKGNLGAVVKAILLDEEARRGDTPGMSQRNFGRIREPFLINSMILRGMECKVSPRSVLRPTEVEFWNQQRPLHAESVFNFHPPDHRAPESDLLAPEQKMLISREYSHRLLRYIWHWESESVLLSAGCNIDPFKIAALQSNDTLVDLLSRRYFRGLMPPPIRSGIRDGISGPDIAQLSITQRIGAAIQLSTLTPQIGAMK